MDKFCAEFAKRLAAAMQAAGYEAKPSVLEREFNLRYWGKPITLQGVRRWLRGEVIPPHDKIVALADWLRVTPQELGFGKEIEDRIQKTRKRWDEGVGYEERDIFEAFLKLPTPQRRLVREVIIAFSRAYPLDEKYQKPFTSESSESL
jgi:transcriptional regulator with XRE-family HTH domain